MNRICAIFVKVFLISALFVGIHLSIAEEPLADGTVAVTSPNGGENWDPGTSHDITWTSFGVSAVKLEYSTDGGSSWTTIESSVTAFPCSYSWTVPDTPSGTCKVRIKNTLDEDVTDQSDSIFQIYESSPPEIDMLKGIEIYDSDHNGKIDRIVLWFDSPLDPSSVESTPANAFIVSGYTIYATLSPAINVANNYDYTDALGNETDDEPLTLFLVEGSDYDTDATPQVIYDASIGLLKGINGKNVESITPAAAVEVDKAPPILINATTMDTNNNNLFDEYRLLFSEPVTASDINGNNNLGYGFYMDEPGFSFSLTGHYTEGNYLNLKVDEKALNGTIPHFSYESAPLTDNFSTAPNVSNPSGKGFIRDYAVNSLGVTSLNNRFYLNILGEGDEPIPENKIINGIIIMELTSPVGGESWEASTTQNITWTSDNVDNVRLEYSTNGGTTWTEIVASTAASAGTYAWTVPNIPSANCLVGISDTNPGVFDQSDEPFTIELTSEYGTQITFSEGEKWFTDWSPDGEWITYSQQGPGGEYDIWYISAAGGEPSNLTLDIDGNCIFPNFTADSQEVTFSSHGPDGWKIKSISIDATSPEFTIVDNGTNGFWSHDGMYLVYRRADTAKLAVYEPGSGSDTVIAPGDPRGGTYWYGVPAFNHDDSHVITSVIDEAYGEHRLYTKPSTGGDWAQLTVGTGYHWYPDYSYSGEWILYSNFIDGFDPGGHSAYAVLWVYNVLTGEEIQVFPGNSVKNYCSSFSPDGTKFCYLLQLNNGYELFITDFPFYPQAIPAIMDIVEKLETLENAGEINKGIAHSLKSKAERAITRLEQGNTTAAANILQAFINHLEAIKGKKIDEEDADELIADAEAIKSVILSGGGVPKRAVSMEETEQESELPGIYSLKQNSPNPFNPTTTISFSLAEAGNVTVAVFNLAGQKVATVANEFMDAGSHSVVWDATDNAGHKVSSGIYIYQLQAGEFTKSNKMILMR